MGQISVSFWAKRLKTGTKTSEGNLVLLGKTLRPKEGKDDRFIKRVKKKYRKLIQIGETKNFFR